MYLKKVTLKTLTKVTLGMDGQDPLEREKKKHTLGVEEIVCFQHTPGVSHLTKPITLSSD